MAARLELYLAEEIAGAPVGGAAVRANAGDFSISMESDAQGLALIELAEVPDHLGLHVTRDGFVPKLVAWDLATVNASWPERFTLKMERSRSIGGVVRNQRGEPVEGADVLVTLRGSSPHGVQPRIYNDIHEQAARTDTEGRWEFKEAPAALSPLWVRLAHPDYISNEHIPTLPPLEDFQKGVAVLTLLKGVPCEGTVTDEEGRPLEGVEVILGEDGADSTSKPRRKTDAAGRFRFGGVTFQSIGEPMVVSFDKKGFAPEMVELQRSSTLVEANAVLRPGKTLRLRCTDEAGAPVAGVTLALRTWRKHRPFARFFESDENGLAVWENAPRDAVGFWVMAKGYQRDEIEVTASDEVQPLVVRKPTFISGRVVNARTGEPIPEFSLVYGRHYPARRGGWSYWNHSWVYPFTNGEYRSSAGDKVVTRSRDGGIAEEGFRRFRVSAPGYVPGISRLIANAEVGEVRCDFALEPAEDMTGVVRDAQGERVAGADIVMATDGNPLLMENGKLHERGSLKFTTDDEGRYVITPQEENFQVAIGHPEAGYLVTTCEELRSAGEARLRAWGRLELRTTATADSVPHYHLREVVEAGRREDRVRFMNNGVVAADGLVVFTGLVAAPMRLYTSGGSMLEGEIISIQAGQTARVDRRSGRRMLTGQIVLPPEGLATEEPLAQLRLRHRPAAEAVPDLKRRADFFEVSSKIDFEGRFRLHDVAPGRYELTGIFFRSLPDGERRGEVAGFVNKEFEVPPGEEVLDLGRLPLGKKDDRGWLGI